MTKAFKKGDLVTYLASWDRKGSVTYRNATVYSCGAKQMILIDDATGEEMGRHFKPEIGDEFGGTFPRMTEAQAIAKALEIGAAIVKRQREHFESRIAHSSDYAGFCDAMRKEIAALHEPRALEYPSR